MTLKHDIQVNVNGSFVKGAIKNGIFISNTLINTGTKEFSQEFVKRVIKELQELDNLMDVIKLTNTLSNDDPNNLF